MQAIRLHEHTGIDGVRVDEVPRPGVGAGRVLVEVRAAGVNPVDWKIAEGLGRDFLGHTIPLTLGADVSGVVAEVGDDVTQFKPGDEVFGYLNLARCGTYAEFVLAEPSELAAKPASLTHAEAAVIPLAGLTSWQALFDRAGLAEGQTVLIHAAAGGVGHLAVQLARHRGARVIATASGPNEAFVRSLGADEFINYRETRFETAVRDVDVVYGTVAGDTLERSFGVLKKGGFLISIVGDPPAGLAERHGVRADNMIVKPDGAQLAELAGLIEQGKLRPTVADTLPLSEGITALRRNKEGHTRGKLVLIP